MEFVADVWAWLSDPTNWSGPRGVWVRLGEHLLVSATATVAAAVAALPAATTLAHGRRAEFLANALVNVGRAVPSFGIIVLTALFTLRAGLGMGFWPTFVALVALGLPPIFTNAYAGVRSVDPAAVEAGRGMGLTERQVIVRIELPLASPVILAGVRIAAVQVIATATIGAILTFGGLGRFIVDGFAQGDDAEVFAGAVLVAGLTVLAEASFTLTERLALPRGVRRLVTRADVAETVHAA